MFLLHHFVFLSIVIDGNTEGTRLQTFIGESSTTGKSNPILYVKSNRSKVYSFKLHTNLLILILHFMLNRPIRGVLKYEIIHCILRLILACVIIT